MEDYKLSLQIDLSTEQSQNLLNLLDTAWTETSVSSEHLEDKFHNLENQALILANLSKIVQPSTNIFRLKRHFKNSPKPTNQSQSLLQASNQINGILVKIASRPELFEQVCRILVEIGNFKMAWIGWLNPLTQQVEPQAVFGDEFDYVQNIRVYADNRPEGKGPIGIALREQRTIIVQDSTTDLRLSPWQNQRNKTNWRSSIAIPICLQTPESQQGILVVYAAEKDFFQETERAMLETVAINLQVAIERNETREQLNREKVRLESILLGTNVGTWEWNIQSGHVLYNDRWAEIIGYTLEELQPLSMNTWRKFCHPDDLAKSDSLLEKHFLGELPYYEVELRMQHKAGHWVWVLDRGKVNEWAKDGKPSWMSGTHQDISEKKQFEESLIQKNDSLNVINSQLQQSLEDFVQLSTELKSSQTTLKAISDSTRDAMILIAPDYKVLFFNKYAKFYFQQYYQKNIEVGDSFLTFIEHEEYLPQFYANFKKALTEEEVKLEIPYTLPNSQPAWFEVRYVPIFKSVGDLLGVAFISSNIDDRKKIEIERAKKNRLLNIINDLQKSFITEIDPKRVFEQALHILLEITHSEYGFIGEVLYNAEGNPYLKTFAITNISWDERTQNFYNENAPKGLEFYNLNSLFGAVMLDQKPMITNSPSTHPRRGGLPPGHPPLNSFLGLPIFLGEKMIGMAGLANSPTGYEEDWISFLQPLLSTIGGLIDATNIKRIVQEKETLLKLSIEASLEAIYILEAKFDEEQTVTDFIIKEVNENAIKQLGMGRQKLIGFGICELFPINLTNGYFEQYKQVFLTQIPLQQEYYIPENHPGSGWYFHQIVSMPKGIVIYNRDITERKKQEELILTQNEELLMSEEELRTYIEEISQVKDQIQENEQYLATLLNNMPVAVYTTDAAGYINFYNQKAIELWEREPEKGKEQWCGSYKLFDKNGNPTRHQDCPMGIAIQEQKPMHAKEAILETPSGKKINFLAHATPFFNKNGEMISAMNVMVDISELKQAEEALKTTQALFEIMANTAPVLIWISDTDKLCTFFNQEWLKFTGRTIQQEVGNGWTEGIHPEDFAHCLDVYNTSFDQRKPFSMDYRLRRHDGVYRWLTDQGVPRFNTNGEFLGYIGSCVDFTDRIEFQNQLTQINQDLLIAEEQLKNNLEQVNALNKKLIISEEALNRAQQIAQVGGWEYDILEDRLTWTRTTYDIHELPYTYEPKVAETINFYAEGENRETIRQLVQEAIEKGFPYDVELQIITANQRTKWVRVKSETHFDNGIATKLIGIFQDISERKDTADQLRQLSDRLTLATKAGGVGVWDYDVVNNHLIWDEQMFKLYGCKPEDFTSVYDAWYRGIYEDDKVRTNEEIGLALRGEKDFNTEFRIVHPNGEMHYIHALAIVQRDKNGQALRMIGTNWDITPIKKFEETILLANERLTQLERFINYTSDAIQVASDDGQLVYINQVASERLGIEPQEMHKYKVSDFEKLFAQPEEWEKHVADLKKQEFITVEGVNYNQKTGKQFPVEVTVRYAFINNKSYIIASSRDITNRRLMEAEVYRLSMVAKHTSNAVIITDTNRQIIWTNDAFSQITGYSFAEVKGKTPRFLQFEETDTATIALINQKLAAKEAVHFEILNKGKYGQIYWLEAEIQPIFDKHNSFIGFMAVESDITQKKQTQDEINHLLNITQSQNHRLREYAHITSHNIRSSVANIIGICEILSQSMGDDPYLKMLDSSVEKLDATIYTMNELLEMENEAQTLSKTTVNVLKAVNHNCGLIQNLWQGKVNIKINIPDNLEVKVIPAYLDSILNNLLTNAIKYRRPDVDAWVEISAYSEKHWIIVEVKDNGMGIDLNRYGNKIYKMKNRFHLHIEGKGIGLFFTKHQIEAMGGQISIESTPQIGTSFKVYLPN